jgi:hypothetical protein
LAYHSVVTRQVGPSLFFYIPLCFAGAILYKTVGKVALGNQIDYVIIAYVTVLLHENQRPLIPQKIRGAFFAFLGIKKALSLVADVLDKTLGQVIAHLPATKRLFIRFHCIMFYLILQPLARGLVILANYSCNLTSQ